MRRSEREIKRRLGESAAGNVQLFVMAVHFFLPYAVTCCICFQCLYSKRIGSEIFAIGLLTLF